MKADVVFGMWGGGVMGRLFPPVTIFLYLFLCAGYFFNAFDWDQRTFKKLIILPLSGVYSNNWLGQIN